MRTLSTFPARMRLSILVPLLLLSLGRGEQVAGTGAASIPPYRSRGQAPRRIGPKSVITAYGKLPMSFEANEGQTDGRVKFLSHGSGYSLFLTSTGAVFSLRRPTRRPSNHAPATRISRPEVVEPPPAVMRMKLVGARVPTEVRGIDPLPGKSNYFMGSDPKKWRTDIPSYSRVLYREVYPGIDLVYHGSQGQLEYDFVVAPGADLSHIRIRFPGATRIRIHPDGDLILGIAGGEVHHRKPIAYQEIAGARQEISSNYLLHDDQVSISVARYDRARPLVVDPVMAYSTYLGGTAGGFGLEDMSDSIAVDAAGNTYVTGLAGSPDFPTVNPLFPSGVRFVSKLNADGSALIYSTRLLGTFGVPEFFLGGCCVAADAAGNAYVTGITNSPDFPTTPGAFRTTGRDFVMKLNPEGNALVYSTFIPASHPWGASIAVDAAGNAYLTGARTDSYEAVPFPTVNPIQATNRGGLDAVIFKLNPAGSALVYSTWLGGSGDDNAYGIAVDAAGSAYVAGSTTSIDFPTLNPVQPTHGGGAFDCWVAKLTAEGSALVYSTYLGGSDDDDCSNVAVDAQGNVNATGSSLSCDFPTRNALQPSKHGQWDGFVTKVNAAGSDLVYSTYVGGSDVDYPTGIGVDSSGNAYVTGTTSSSDFPTVDPLQASYAGASDVFVTKIDASGSALVYSTYLGGSGQESARGIAVDSAGSAHITGYTYSSDFPTANALQPANRGGVDTFVVKISDPSCPEEITDQVDILRSGFHRIWLTPLRFQLVVITNTSADPISGPLAYVTADLRNAILLGSRRTVCLSPTGDPFVVVHAGGDEVLGPDERTFRLLLFWKTQPGRIEYTTRLLTSIATP